METTSTSLTTHTYVVWSAYTVADSFAEFHEEVITNTLSEITSTPLTTHTYIVCGHSYTLRIHFSSTKKSLEIY